MTSETHKATVWEDKGMYALLERRCDIFLKGKKIEWEKKTVQMA